MPIGLRWGPGALIGCLVAAWLGGATPCSGADWERVSDTGGMVVERRPATGSQAFEIRVTARSRVSPAIIFDTLWNHREYPQFIPYLKRLDLLSDSADERVVYEQVAVPLARDRDYTVRLRKRVDAATQHYEIMFVTANEAGPPPDRHHVRVQRMHGNWTVQPGADGTGSLLRYDVVAEPGGAIPAWLANRAQREAVAALVTAVLTRARENEGPVIRRAPERDAQKSEGPVIRRAPERDGQN